jgi:dynein heavy chain
MIDPQSQAINWIKNREKELEEFKYIFQLSNPNLRDALKIPLMDGMPVLIENVENEVDVMLDPLLEKQITVKGRTKLITLGDQQFDFHDNFRMYMTSRLPNPHWSPELAAKTTIIDFAVTQGGLEQQLLGRLISKEQRPLEDSLNQVKESVNQSTKLLKKLENDLLLRLATAEGSLLDDAELIDVLGNIKLKSSEVSQSLIDAGIKSTEIGHKREEFRPVAARGAVLYFCIVEMSSVNWMYNVSLGQFLELFDKGITTSQPDQIVSKRVENIINCMTYITYRYINRGLFEADKVTFKLMMCMRILMQEHVITSLDVSLFLKAGSAVDDRNKKFGWMDKKVWDNLIALSKHKFGADQSNFFFKGVIDSISRNTQDWRSFYESDTPETDEVPDYQEKIHADSLLGSFLHLCLVRCMREDRTMLVANKFIASKLTTKFTEPPDDQIADVWAESAINKPILYLLSTGADPTSMI